MDWLQIKNDFPILKRQVHGVPLVYLDSAATAQKPQVVIDAIVEYYTNHNANVHRGIHVLGDESTRLFIESREKVARFFGAEENELVWVRNTTEAINLVRLGWVKENLGSEDLIITSELEHHSNLVVWQKAAKETGAQLTFVDAHSTSSGSSTSDGQIDLNHLEAMLETFGEKVGLIALTLLSNATGAVLDIKRVVELKNKYARRAKILVDCAQGAPIMPINFGEMGVDFLAFSGHKLYGPMGIGGLIVKREVLEDMDPVLVGGGMISEVHLSETEYGELPDRFDAGTPDVAGVVGLAAACEYLEKIGMEKVEEHSRELVVYALEKLGEVEGVKIIGPTGVNIKHEIRNPKSETNSKSKIINSKWEQRLGPSTSSGSSLCNRLGSVAFTVDGVHAHDVAQILDSVGVAVRSGHHCTMPLHEKLGLAATTRASFGIYNTKEDVDRLVEGLGRVRDIFKVNSKS